MKNIIFFLYSILLITSCSKEVKLDIPGHEPQLVIDGRIETGQPPLVLLSRSNDVYSPTNLEAYLNGFVSGAIVTVSNGTTTVQLEEICTDNLPAGTEELAASIFGIPVAELSNYNLCAYTSFNTAIWGQIGKTYSLTVVFEGRTYTSSTSILQPTTLVSTFWKPDGDLTEYGYSWATLADVPGQSDYYKWEVRYIGDDFYTKTFNPFFDDKFFDGLTFDFAYENPMSYNDPALEHSPYHGYYKIGDTIVIKLSKMDEKVFEFMEKKYSQIYSAGNPFATPTNIPSNITGGALGVWAGYSPSFDTLICVP